MMWRPAAPLLAILLLFLPVVVPVPAALGAGPKPRAPESPRLYVPARPDSVSIESEAAPLIVPGRSGTIDSTARTPQQFAREQLALGLELERSGNRGAAMIAYANAVRADSTLPLVCLQLGRMEMSLGRTLQAERLFREELRRNPRDADAPRELGL